MARNRLFIRQLQTVGFVDKGDNPTAEVVFFKRADEPAQPEPKDGAVLRALKALARKMGMGEDEVTKLLDEDGSTVIPPEDDMSFDVTKLDAPARAEFEKQQERIEELEGQVTDLTAKLEEAEGGEEGDVLKGVTPEVRTLIEKERAEREKTEASLQKLMDERENERFIRKAESLKLPADDWAGTLRKMAGTLEADEFKKVEELIKSLREQAAEGGLYKQFGVSGDGEPSSTEKELAEEVEKLRREEPTFSKERARGEVMRRRPDLRRKLEEERSERVRHLTTED